MSSTVGGFVHSINAARDCDTTPRKYARGVGDDYAIAGAAVGTGIIGTPGMPRTAMVGIA